jgi:7-carboxy-7-deazaguanine synthase
MAMKLGQCSINTSRIPIDMKIHSIFRSIDGEVNCNGHGQWSTFVRLQGCNLKCAYCDTAYAQSKDLGTKTNVGEVYLAVKEMKCQKVTITGGEPMMQAKDVFDLTRLLRENNHKVSIETNGSFLPVGYGVECFIMDWKLSNSNMQHKMGEENFLKLRAQDYIKFVIGPGVKTPPRHIFHEALGVMKVLKGKGCRATFAFSPDMQHLAPRILYLWMESEMEKNSLHDCVLNIQLHKVLQVP